MAKLTDKQIKQMEHELGVYRKALREIVTYTGPRFPSYNDDGEDGFDMRTIAEDALQKGHEIHHKRNK